MLNPPIPYRPRLTDLPTASAQLLKSQFLQNRRLLLENLRCIPALAEAATHLSPKALYTLEIVPEGATMYKDTAGRYKGVFYKNGRIVQQARLRDVSPSLLKAASAIGSQVLLVSIAIQLNRVEKAVEGLCMQLHNDRIAEIEAGRKQFERAVVMREATNRMHALHHAIQSLSEGVAKTIKALRHEIADAPDPDNRFLDNWGKAKWKIAAEKMALAEESYRATLMGIGVLSEAYAFLNEPAAATKSLRELLMDLRNAGIEEAREKASLVPPRSVGVYPEGMWDAFLKAEPKLLQSVDVCNRCWPDALDHFAAKVKPSELLER